MDQPLTIGLDRAKNVFQVHGMNAEGPTFCRRQLRRSQVLVFFSRSEPCLAGMEDCGEAHYRSRELAAVGHEMRLMPSVCVKLFVKRGKSDGEEDRGCGAAA